MATLQEIAIRIMTDETFAATLLAHPAEVLAAEGIEPTPEVLESVQGITVEDLRSLTAAFGDESKAM